MYNLSVPNYQITLFSRQKLVEILKNLVKWYYQLISAELTDRNQVALSRCRNESLVLVLTDLIMVFWEIIFKTISTIFFFQVIVESLLKIECILLRINDFVVTHKIFIFDVLYLMIHCIKYFFTLLTFTFTNRWTTNKKAFNEIASFPKCHFFYLLGLMMYLIFLFPLCERRYGSWLGIKLLNEMLVNSLIR